MTIGNEKHPADEIGRALSQAGGILASLSNCYDETQKNFEIAQPFVSEALKAIEGILAKANTSLANLYENYDLSNRPGFEADKAIAKVASETSEEDESPTSDSNSEEVVHLGYFGRQSPQSKFSSQSPSDEDQDLTAEDFIEQPAQNYEELFEKLTAMADAASYSEGESKQLLPVLESLRQDIERIRNSA